jgi:hypothetical protein
VKRWFALVLVGTAVAMSACGRAPVPTTASREPEPLPPRGEVSALVVAQSDRVPWSSGQGPAPTLVYVIGLDAKVATSTVPCPVPSLGGAMSLSPDGRRVLYAPIATSTTLRVRDLSSGEDTLALAIPSRASTSTAPAHRRRRAFDLPVITCFGWDAAGKAVAATAMAHNAGGSMSTDTYSDAALWRGEPGRMTSSSIDVAGEYALGTFLGADATRAWFLASAQEGPIGARRPGYVVRHYAGSSRVTTITALTGDGPGGRKVGEPFTRLALPYDGAWVQTTEFVRSGVPAAAEEVHTESRPARQYFGTLQRVDILPLDGTATRSVDVTSSGTTGNYVFPNEWGLPIIPLPKDLAGLPSEPLALSGDWGLPIFDAGYSRFARSQAVTGGAEIGSWKVGGGRATLVVDRPDPYASILGFVDDRGTLAYTASHKGKPAVFLEAPGQGSRLLAELPAMGVGSFPTFHPVLLGYRFKERAR